MKRLVIFDWDGTLSNSLARIVACIGLAAEEVGVVPPAESEAREIVGLGLQEAFRQLYPGAEDQQVQLLKASYSKHFAEKDCKPSPFYDGVGEVLNRLKARGLLLAVATGKSRRGLNRVFAAHGMSHFFHGSRCADETVSKPHPLMLHQLLEQFQLTADQAVMVGDTEFDMAMAQNAEMPKIAVSYGAHASERLEKYRPLDCADTFFQVEEAVLDFIGG